LCPAAYTWSTPFIYVDHDVSLPAIPPLRVRAEGGNHLIVGFATSLVACQHIDSFPPGFVYPVALQTDYVPSRHMLSELERLITAFTPHPLPSLYSPRAGLVSHMAQAMSTTQTIRLPRAVSTGSTSFPIFPLITPTRTSLASFEPLLTLLTCCCLSHFVLLFFDPHRCPALALGQFQGALAKWYSVCGPWDLLS
jgi:hypothetical protein